MQDSFLNHARFRYLWWAMILMIGSLVAYIWHDPFVGPNGGTWLGYTLGTIGAVLIVWLTLFGYRKRTYNNRLGSLRGWLSGHVYLGASLILIATLHTGFQFGWNIHTAAYVLMMIVIFSGFFGIYAYSRYPTLMTRNRANTDRATMLAEIAELDDESLRVADKLGPKVHAMVVRSIENTKLGGGVWAQLTAADATESALEQTRDMIEEVQASDKKQQTQDMPTMFAMVDFLAGSGGEDAERLRRLLDLLSRKKALASKIARDIHYQAMMDIWLFLHVPMTFALLGALSAHIVSVFYYW
ncbi:MAG: hypothetical protein AAGE01_06225 [Pseudomonadota bacterium]